MRVCVLPMAVIYRCMCRVLVDENFVVTCPVRIRRVQFPARPVEGKRRLREEEKDEGCVSILQGDSARSHKHLRRIFESSS